MENNIWMKRLPFPYTLPAFPFPIIQPIQIAYFYAISIPTPIIYNVIEFDGFPKIKSNPAALAPWCIK